MAIRVMVVDDSSVIRKVVRSVIDAEPDMEVVEEASDGRAALQRLREIEPDVLTLDVEMPHLDGVETVRALRPGQRRLPVIMFSTLTERGAQVTVEALLSGANDYVHKPSASNIADAQQQVRATLIPKIRALGGRRLPPSVAPRTAGSDAVRPKLDPPDGGHDDAVGDPGARTAADSPTTTPAATAPGDRSAPGVAPRTAAADAEAPAVRPQRPTADGRPASPRPNGRSQPLQRRSVGTSRQDGRSTVRTVARRSPTSPSLGSKAQRPGAGATATTHGARSAPVARRAPRIPAPVGLVVIGISTGGPNALAQLLPQLPGGLRVPVVVVQHMPPTFTRMLADRLDAASTVRVAEAQGGEIARPGEVWIAQGGRHLLVERTKAGPKLLLNDDPPVQSCRPAADLLFASAAEAYGAATLAVVMTGMGHDGLEGAAFVAEAGGVVLAQDEPSSVVWGMPGAVSRAGLADELLPLDRIAREITQRVVGPPRG